VNADQHAEQTVRAQRMLTHFHFTMAFLSVNDVPSADDYLKDVRSREGNEMYRGVLDMISLHTRTPLES
jgi:hypothetical protein